MSNTAVQKCEDFLRKENFFCAGKSMKKVSCQIYDTWFHKKRTQLSGKDFKLISFNKFNSLCQSCFGKLVPCSHVNRSPKNNRNLKTHFHMNIIITPRSNKANFYNNRNYIEMPFDDNDHHTLINSKQHDLINERNALNNKANYFGILYLNIVCLNKHVDSLSNVLV